MSDEGNNDIKVAMGLEEQAAGPGDSPAAFQSDPFVNKLWNTEDAETPEPIEEMTVSDELRFELDNLAMERERLMDEKRKLSQVLESMKLEEDLALMKKEVDALAEENMNILLEIQRRKQSLGTT